MGGSTVMTFGLSDPAFLAACQPAVGFNPLSIPGCVFCLMADGNVYTTGTTQATDGQTVETWENAGSGNDATEATNKPTFKTNIINGLPVIRFDGVNDQLVTGTNTLTQPTMAFCVAKHNGSGPETLYAAGLNFLVEVNRTANQLDLYPSPLKAGYTSGTFFQSTVLASGSSSQVWLNGSGSGTGSFTTSAGSDLKIGVWGPGSDPFTGDIAEIIAYDSVLSDSDREAVEDYLGTKYGITITH